MKRIPITEARDHLTRLLREVERDEPVELTRHGKSVVVMISSSAFERLTRERTPFTEALTRFRQGLDPELDLAPDEVFAGLRDRSSGREVDL